MIRRMPCGLTRKVEQTEEKERRGTVVVMLVVNYVPQAEQTGPLPTWKA